MVENIRQITEHKILEMVKDLKYYTYTHGKSNYNLHFFCYVFDNEKELLEQYEAINDTIAFNFQSHIKKKIEKWNIYFFLFLKGTIIKSRKVTIEQNKYATRKIIFDCFGEDSIIENQIATIEKKVLLLGVKTAREKAVFNTTEPDVVADIKKLLKDLREKSNREKKEIINTYVKGVNNEH